jgi:hypothetical protein
MKTVLILLCIIILLPLALCSLGVMGIGGGIVGGVSTVQQGLHDRMQHR